MSGKSSYAIAVVGAGVAGLSTAFHLKKMSVGPVVVIDPALQQVEQAASWRTPGYAMGGMWDQYTRFHHTFGEKTATALWKFSIAAFDTLQSFLEDRGVAYQQCQRLRCVTSAHELKEVQTAVRLLNEAGCPTILSDADVLPHFQVNPTPKIVGVEDEGRHALIIADPSSMSRTLQDLLRPKTTFIPQRAVHLALKPHGAEITLSSGETVFAEMVVLACHLGAKTLVPELQDVLISVADQWMEIRGEKERQVFASFQHGYGWLAGAGKRIFMGGGRHMRKWAGIEAEVSTYHEKAEQFLLQWGEALTAPEEVSAERVVRRQALLDCRPCDELPLIGPLYGSARLHIAAGFMGQGLTLGFMAGKELAHVIATGRAYALPQALLPERLRSFA